MNESRIARILGTLARERAVAILRTARAEAVLPALSAAVEGGFRILEVTLNTPGALDAIADLSSRPGLSVGAGTVLTMADARAAADAGAEFLVSPVADPEVIRFAAAQDLLAVPGAFTPGEMLAAHRAGAPVVKLFPAPPDGPGYVRSILGPLPFLRILPTSGVTRENAAAFLRAGAFAVGLVNVLFDAEELAAGRFDAVCQRARDLLAAMGEAGS